MRVISFILNRPIILTLLLVCFYSASNAQSLIIDEYTSEYERKIFEQLLDNKEIEPIDILFAVDYNLQRATTAKHEIQKLKDNIQSKGIEGKSTKKQIQTVYKTVHNQMLNHYQLNADFNQIFEKGQYNCVSASALYALIFDEFNIPYQIKELPTHVYIIGNPQGKNIMVESTNPSKGAYKVDEKEKQRIVNYLYANKIISQSDYNTNSTNTLYEKHHNKTKDIDLKQLAALIYYNRGVDHHNEKRFGAASVEFTKAYTIYPSKQIKFLLTASLENDLRHQINTKTYNSTSLINYLNLNKEIEASAGFGFDVFRNFSIAKGIQNPDLDSYKAYFEQLQTQLDSSIDLDNYNQIYYRVLAYNLYANQQNVEALNQLYYAYVANPNNLQTKEMIEEIVRKHLMNDRDHQSTLDSINSYMELFPFLEENRTLQEYHSYCALRSAYENIYFKRGSSGEELLQLFERSIRSPQNYSYQLEYFEKMYATIIALYTERNQISKARNLLQRGLYIEPNSVPLHELQSLFREYSNSLNTTYNPEPVLTREEKFKRDTKAHLSNCWEVAKAHNREGKRIRPPVQIKFDLNSDNSTIYALNNQSKKGKWSLRTRSRLLYLIPERDKSQYTMLKIETITADQMEIRTFNGKKMNPYTITLRTCPVGK